MLLFVWILVIAICVIMAFVCAGMARRRGRDVALWATLGALFGLVAVIILAASGDAEKKQKGNQRLKNLVDTGAMDKKELKDQNRDLLR